MAYPHLIDLYGKCNIGINHNVDMDCLGMDLFPFVQNEIPGGVLMFTLFRCPVFFSEGLRIFGFSDFHFQKRTKFSTGFESQNLCVLNISRTAFLSQKRCVFGDLDVFNVCFHSFLSANPPTQKKTCPYGLAFRPSHRHKYSCNQWLLSTHHNDTNGETSQN